MDMHPSGLMRMSELAKLTDPNCPICQGEGWVCEDHPTQRWYDGHGCCGGPGMPCKCSALAEADKNWEKNHAD